MQRWDPCDLRPLTSVTVSLESPQRKIVHPFLYKTEEKPEEAWCLAALRSMLPHYTSLVTAPEHTAANPSCLPPSPDTDQRARRGVAGPSDAAPQLSPPPHPTPPVSSGHWRQIRISLHSNQMVTEQRAGQRFFCVKRMRCSAASFFIRAVPDPL